MKKIDLINKLVEERDIQKKEATNIVEHVIELMKQGVVDDGELDLYGFIKIISVHKDATTARNPKTGETVNVAEKNVPKAKFAKTFKDALNS